jgi:hypothetical protein
MSRIAWARYSSATPWGDSVRIRGPLALLRITAVAFLDIAIFGSVGSLRPSRRKPASSEWTSEDRDLDVPRRRDPGDSRTARPPE